MKYNKELLDKFINEKVAVATRTQKEFDGLMELLESETNLTWSWGENPTENKGLWCYEKHETAVICDFFDEGEIGFSPSYFYKEHGYEIIEYQEIVKGGKGMKTNEFIKRVEALGYEVDNGAYDSTVLYIRTNDVLTATIKADELNSVNTRCSTDIPSELFDLLVEYARTPIEEREEQPKYYWKIKGLGKLLTNEKYLNLTTSGGTTLSTKKDTISFQTQFTEKEFKEICEKHNITAEFEKEEIGGN